MKFPAQIALLIVPFLLAACDEQPHKPPVPHTGDAKQGPVLFEDQRNALGKAKAVGAKAEEQAQSQREAVEKQEK